MHNKLKGLISLDQNVQGQAGEFYNKPREWRTLGGKTASKSLNMGLQVEQGKPRLSLQG